jgi:hypothetical protein
MNEEFYLQLFRREDTSLEVEQPPGFDYGEAMRRFAALTRDLGLFLGCPVSVENGAKVQDAAHHGEIELPADALRVEARTCQHVALHLSNFGRFAAIWGEDFVESDKLSRIVQILEKHGYVFIPQCATRLPYSGLLEWLPRGATWWDRFFAFL